MNKSDMIDTMAEAAGISKAQAGEALNALVDGITASLKKKKDVSLIGFGSFSINRRKARKGRNPATGEEIKIKAQTGVKFRAGKALKEAVNK
jgi:DNA-binding protein HU-beta